MGNVFGDQKTFKQIVREQKRTVDRSIRGLERESQGMNRNEATLINDIRKAAKAGQIKSAKTMAKDLVRTRRHKEKFTNLIAQLRVLSMQMTEVASQHALAESMKNVTKAMSSLNKQLNLPELQSTLVEFQKQSESMEMKQEMMGDALDEVFEDDESAAESEEVVNAILDEIGIKLNESLVSAPTAVKAPVVEAQSEAASSVPAKQVIVEDEDAALAARLAKLKK